jgi:hypothetical protein
MLRQDVIATSTSRAVDGFSMLETCPSTSGASNPESLRVARSCELALRGDEKALSLRCYGLDFMHDSHAVPQH